MSIKDKPRTKKQSPVHERFMVSVFEVILLQFELSES